MLTWFWGHQNIRWGLQRPGLGMCHISWTLFSVSLQLCPRSLCALLKGEMSATFQNYKTVSLHMHEFLLRTDLERCSWMELDTILFFMWCDCQSKGHKLSCCFQEWNTFYLGLTGHNVCLTRVTTLEFWFGPIQKNTLKKEDPLLGYMHYLSTRWALF